MALYTDRTYFLGTAAWHAFVENTPAMTEALCGWLLHRDFRRVQRSDRVPANGHLCGRCSRVIAARTDVEPSRRTEDVPEPTATEQDDWSPV